MIIKPAQQGHKIYKIWKMSGMIIELSTIVKSGMIIEYRTKVVSGMVIEI